MQIVRSQKALRKSNQNSNSKGEKKLRIITETRDNILDLESEDCSSLPLSTFKALAVGLPMSMLW